jgi:hypothetical protein
MGKNVTDNRVAPLDIEAEERLLECILHPDGVQARDAVSDVISEEHFYHSYNGRIFSVILERHEAGLPVDDFSIESYQAIAKQFPNIGGSAAIGYMEELRERSITGSVKQAIYYANRIKEAACLRECKVVLAEQLFELDQWKPEHPKIGSERLLDRVQTLITTYAPVKHEPGAKTLGIELPLFDSQKLTPPPGLLRDYCGYMAPLTEAPLQFHLFAGLMMLATIIQQGVHWVIADDIKYLNLWAVLVAPSGAKKSTAISRPRQILANNGFKDLIFPTQITTERLIPLLSQRNVGTFFWPEWGATMDQWGKTYAMDAMSIFTTLFDGGYFSRWLRNEKYEIMNTSISLFCGCTFEWLKRTMKPTDVGMGYWPRFLFIPALKREKYLAETPKGNLQLKEHIVGQLKQIQTAFPTNEPREANFDAVNDLYKYWYEKANKAADQDSTHPYISAFVVRLSDYAKKLATLVEISSSQTVDISPATMSYTLALVDWLQQAAIYVVSSLGKDELAEVEERVYEMINKAGNIGIKHSELRQKLHRLSKTHVEMAISSLEDAEKIRVVEFGKTGRGRPGRKYILV